MRARVIPAPVVIELPGRALHVAFGDVTAYALHEDGTVVVWGANDEGQFGAGTRDPAWTPAEVAGLDRPVAIAAGSGGGQGFSAAVRTDGTFWNWGADLGDGRASSGRTCTRRRN